MVENEGVALRAIRWSEIFPWLSIAKSFRLAVTLRLMTFGAAAVLLTLLGWWVIAGIFSHDGSANGSWTGAFGTSRPGKSSMTRCRTDRLRPEFNGSRAANRGLAARSGLKIHVCGPDDSHLGRAQSAGVADLVDPAAADGRVVDGQ